jgi:DNA repair ATPase RecN
VKSKYTLSAKTPLERVQESEKLLERIMLAVPGFRGYKLREQRREADRIVRDYIYRSLEQSRDDLTGCLQALSDSKALELMEPMNRLLARLDRVAAKINHASYGYSGFFDSIKIEEVELDKMLSYDTQLMDLARKFSSSAGSFKDELTKNKLENARIAQKDLDDSVANLESTFDQRKSVIEGVKV